MLPYQTNSNKEDGIAIVGIGGAGANVLQCFGASSAEHVRLYTMSLDERLGRDCGNVEFIQLGEVLSRGLGSGGDPEVGRRAMEESSDAVRRMLADCKLLVLVVGLGGGTGSGAAPVMARIAREAGLFLVSVVMMPFSFEGKRRREQAEQAHEEIARLSDIVYCFENDYMEELFRNRSGARAVFEEVDRLLAKAAASVPMIATSPGLINLGLDELATALENHDSRCIFGSGSGYGSDRAVQAAQEAVNSPLTSYHGALRYARAVIVHIAGGESLSLSEINRAMEIVRSALGGDDVAIFFGATVRAHLGEELRITLIASIDAEEFKTVLLQEPAPTALNEPEPEPAPESEEEEDTPGAPALPAEPEEEPEPEEPAADDNDAVDDIPEPEEEEEEEEEEEAPAPEEEEETPPPARPTPAPRPAPAPAPAPTPAPRPTPTPAPAPKPAPAPAPAPKPEPTPAPAPTKPQPPQQLDLFASHTMRTANEAAGSATTRYSGSQNYPYDRHHSQAYTTPAPEGGRRSADMTADDWDIPPSRRPSILNDIFPDN